MAPAPEVGVARAEGQRGREIVREREIAEKEESEGDRERNLAGERGVGEEDDREGGDAAGG